MSAPGLSRRAALQGFAAGAAALVAGCKPGREIVPYRDMPEGMVPGKPLFFATSLPLGGAGRGVIVESHEGRPTKVHGNPAHPASLGATDIFAESEILTLFDPDRSRSVRRAGVPASWNQLARVLAALPASGEGVAVLTGRIGSPTLARQLRALVAARPKLRLYSAPGPGPELELFADLPQAVQLWPDFTRIDTVVTLAADPLGPGPAQIALARGWAEARRARPDRFRSYAFEPAPSLTGLRADHRQAVAPTEIGRVLAALRDGGEGLAGDAAQRLRAAGQRAVVLPGRDLPADQQAATLALNRQIGAPLRALAPFWRWPGLEPGDAAALLRDIGAGRLRTLIVIGTNPVHDLGADFAEAIATVPQPIHFGLAQDETAAASLWHAPLHHPLEDWSDLRGVEGTVGLVQPLIAPLHDSRSVHEVLSMLVAPVPDTARDILRQTWREQWTEDGPDKDRFERRWMRALHDGVVAGTAGTSVDWPAPTGVATATVAAPPPGSFRLVLRRGSLFEAAQAGNAWLQECPEPLTKEVWGNALWLAAADAARLGLSDGDLVRLHSDRGEVLVPVLVVAGQAPGTVSLAVGYGRTRAGPIGSGIGVRSDLGPVVQIETTGRRGRVIRLQTEMDQHGRDLLRTVAPDAALPQPPPRASFYDRPATGPSWGMVIDTDACIGCNACTIACQSENNIPVVGPDEAARGRRMHWMRIDAYALDHGGAGFQPVPCMHCARAPCEPVCPVAASVHDSEGLNVQVYNRCIGTRFCQANCPYQVRRFNFFDYSGSQAPADLGDDLLAALRNPDVTVRGRGVMEKCTYCVQRISAARRQSESTDQPLADGDVVTACQAACPTQAISFGDLADPASAVAGARQNPRHYALLEHLGTQPHTTYLARIVPGPEDEQ